MSVAKHTLYNIVGATTPVFVSLVTVPLYIHTIGIDRYGVLALCWALAGYFGFFDFGMGRAVTQRMAMLGTSEDARNRLFWSALLLSLGLCLIAAIVFWPVAYALFPRFEATGTIKNELNRSIGLLVFAVPMGVLSSFLGGVLEGRSAFGRLNTIAVAANILVTITPLIAAVLIAPSLPVIITTSLLARAVTLTLLAVSCASIVPVSRPAMMNKQDMLQIVGFGSWTTISNIVGPILSYFDRFAIGAVLGPAAVGYYVLGFNLVNQLSTIPISLARALLPQFSGMSASDTLTRSNVLMRLMVALTTPITIGTMLFAGPFFTLWVGEKIARFAAPVAVVLLVGFATNSSAFIPSTRLQARSRPDLIAKAHLAELIPYCLLLWLCLRYFGVMGAATAWSVRVTADLVILLALDGMARMTARIVSAQTLVVTMAAVVLLADISLVERLVFGILVIVAGAWLSIRSLPKDVPSSLRHMLRQRFARMKRYG